MSEEQFERLRPLLPNKVRGVARVDDWCVISGIIHAVKSGGPPAEVLIDSTHMKAHRPAGAEKGAPEPVGRA